MAGVATKKLRRLASDKKIQEAVTKGGSNLTGGKKSSGTVEPVGELNRYWSEYQSDPNKLQGYVNNHKRAGEETKDSLKQSYARLDSARKVQTNLQTLNYQKDQHQAEQLSRSVENAGHTIGFLMNGLGRFFTSMGSGANNVANITTNVVGGVTNTVGGVTKSIGSTVTGAVDTTFKSVSSKPILWLIVGIIFVLFIVALIYGLVSRYSGGSGDDEYDDSNVTRIEINGDFGNFGDFNSIRRGQTYSPNSVPISRPSFTKAPDVNGGIFDWILNSIATTEPFASGITYYNMVKEVATGGSLVKINREVDIDGRHDNIVAININNEIHNILAPKPVIWSINEYQRDDLRILPNDFKKKIQDKYTVHIPWEKDGDHYYVKCNKTYYDNDKNKKINILLDTNDKDMCSIYQDGEAKPLYK